MRINIIPIRELIIPIRFRIANTNRTNLFFNDYFIRCSKLNSLF